METSILLQIRCCTWSWAHSLCFSTPTASTAVQESVQGSGPSQAEHGGTLRVWLQHHMVPLAKRWEATCAGRKGRTKFVISGGQAGCWLGHQAGGVTLGCDIRPHTCSKLTRWSRSRRWRCVPRSSSAMTSLPRCWQSQPQRLGVPSDLG